MQESWEPDWLLPEQFRALTPGEGLDRAIADAVKAVLAEIENADHYHLLFHLLNKNQDYDGSWCVAGLLAAFGKATRTEGEWYRENLEQEMIDPDRALDDEDWLRYLICDQQDLVLSQVFGISYLVAGDVMHHQPLALYGLDATADRVDLERASSASSAIRMGARMLGMPSPPAVFRHATGRGISCLPTHPMACAFGADVDTDVPAAALRFMAGKALAYFYLWHPMAALYEPMQLGFMLMAIARVAAPEMANFSSLDSLAKDLERALGQLSKTLDKRLMPAQRQLLRDCFEAYHEAGRPLDVGDWDAHVELTANHVGLYLSDDPETVGSFLLNEYSALSPADTRTKIEDFVTYIVAGRYRGFRRALGLDIQI